MTISAYFR